MNPGEALYKEKNKILMDLFSQKTDLIIKKGVNTDTSLIDKKIEQAQKEFDKASANYLNEINGENDRKRNLKIITTIATLTGLVILGIMFMPKKKLKINPVDLNLVKLN